MLLTYFEFQVYKTGAFHGCCIWSLMRGYRRWYESIHEHARDVESSMKPALQTAPIIFALNRGAPCLDNQLDELSEMLADAEKKRLREGEYARYRRRYVISRAISRMLFESLTGESPSGPLFQNGDTAAPLIKITSGGHRISFSVSHTKQESYFAFAQGNAVGLDVEYRRRVREPLLAAEYAFAPVEVTWLKALSPDQLDSAFLRLWTRKEAVIKMHQGSIAHDMDRFTVPLDTSLGVRSIDIPWHESSTVANLADFQIGNRVLGSVCWVGGCGDIGIFELDPKHIRRLNASLLTPFI